MDGSDELLSISKGVLDSLDFAEVRDSYSY